LEVDHPLRYIAAGDAEEARLAKVGCCGAIVARLGEIIIVANRLPVQRVRQGRSISWDASPGGLVSAVTPVLRKHGGAWVGWPGVAGSLSRTFTYDGIRIVPVGLTQNEVEHFYLGFANRTIWPLYHDVVRIPTFHRTWWKPYVDVNRRFALRTAKLAARRQMVWVHDYQLQLVPRFLRELRPDLRIGFFLHIPFPPDELFAWLPWRKEVLEGLLGADVVGFQTQPDARDFANAARRFTAADGTETHLHYKDRTVQVAAFPISIDFGAFEALAGAPQVIKQAQSLRRQVGGSRKIVLSIDRLDYTKGIDTRLLAFEELLRRRRASVDDCVLIQIAVPSRESAAEYREMRTRIEQIVGRINGDYSVPGKVAVHYFRRSFPREELAAFYVAADIMAVTPLKDGMNLVAKEYVATRRDNSGVLVLSEFAGAAHELRRALLVNPRDLDGMVRTLDTALHLPAKEARFRMSILRTQVRRHDVKDWARDFLEALRG
jgi:trehalose 6-phosphate synthase